MTAPSLQSRVRGALFGLATCDALGGPVEFKTRGTFPQIRDMKPNPTFSLPAGCFTDDTSMTLCLAQSLIDSQGFDAQDQVQKYIAWFLKGYMSSVPERGCFDIGVGTRAVLMAWNGHFKENGYGKSGSSARAVTEDGQRMINSRFEKESYCGNGSLMRVLPIALAFYAIGIDEAISRAKESSQVTHPHSRCQEACSLYTQLVVNVLQGADKGALAEIVATARIEDEPLRDRLQRYQDLDSWGQQVESNIRSTGYVIDTLEAALWAFFTTESFEDGAIRAVNLGDDADTVGAVYGGLAGAYHGFDAIPARWLKPLTQKDLLQQVCQGLETLEGNLGKEDKLDRSL